MAASLLNLDPDQTAGKKLLFKAIEIESNQASNINIQRKSTPAHIVNNINTTQNEEYTDEIPCNNINTRKVDFKTIDPTDTRRRNHSPPPGRTTDKPKSFDRNTLICHACLLPGHVAYRCPDGEAYRNYCYERDRYTKSQRYTDYGRDNRSIDRRNSSSRENRPNQQSTTQNAYNRSRSPSANRSDNFNRSRSTPNQSDRKLQDTNIRQQQNWTSNADVYPKHQNTASSYLPKPTSSVNNVSSNLQTHGANKI